MDETIAATWESLYSSSVYSVIMEQSQSTELARSLK